MVEAVKQYILCTTNRHVNFEKLLSIRKSHPKNFTYANLLLKVFYHDLLKVAYILYNVQYFVDESFIVV